MTTHITLEDGRILGTTNGVFDAIMERAAAEIADSTESGHELHKWLLGQRCEILGPGVGYLDLRELSPRARSMFRSACVSALYAEKAAPLTKPWLVEALVRLKEMWSSINRGDPPESLTDPNWGIAPPTDVRSGPGWE